MIAVQCKVQPSIDCEKVQDQAVQRRPSLQSIAKKEAGSDSEAGVRWLCKF